MLGQRDLEQALASAALEARRQSGCFLIGEQFNPGDLGPEIGAKWNRFLARESEFYGTRSDFFARLREELLALRSPRVFLERCAGLAECCLKLAEDLSALSKQRRAEDTASVACEVPTGELFELAAQIARMGSVEQVYRSAVTQYRAEQVRVSGVGHVMSGSAKVDLEQGQFFAELKEWLLSQISPGRGRQIRGLEVVALVELRERVTEEQGEEELVPLGLPGAVAREAMLDVLEVTLWNSAGLALD